MFDFLKKAIKSFSNKLSKPEKEKKEEEKKAEAPVEEVAEEKLETPSVEKEVVEEEIKPEKVKVEELAVEEEIPTEIEKPKELKKLEAKEEGKGFLKKLAAVITEAKVTEEQFYRLFRDLEI